MASLSIPTTSTLDPAQRVPSNDPAVSKILNRLSRPSLLSLALDWLDDRNQDITAPYLAMEDEEIDPQDLYPPVQSLEELREIYTDMQQRKGGKRDVVDRIIEGDWRDGISLYQIAMVDMQYLYDHPTSQKWTALKVVQLAPEGAGVDTPPSPPLTEKPTTVPRFHPATFLQNLQSESLPDVKAHYNLDRHPRLPLLLLRSNQITTFDSSRTFYVAFPDASPFVYVSLTTSSTTNTNLTSSSTAPSKALDTRSLRKLTLDSIPKAFSRPRQRYGLETTNLSARNLEALVERRGGGRTNAAGGGWSVYAGENRKDTPLNIIPDAHLPTPEASTGEEEEEEEEGGVGLRRTITVRGLKRKSEDDEAIVKRRKKIAEGRFGNSARLTDGKGIERVEVRIDDPYLPVSANRDDDNNNNDDDDDDDETDFKPNVRITFTGTHVFAGIRELVEAGVIDGVKMPGWMTGEEGVSIGVVENWRIKGFKGSGI
ncbi:hypothetical protein B7463_g12436, partial [Scytalidium lignicola]